MKRLIMTLAILAFAASGAMADIVIFKSGGAKEGIIEEETPTSVRLRVRGAVIGFSRSNIERIEYASDEENEKLYDKWLQEVKDREEARDRKREDKKKFEKQQQEKGLIKVGDEWVTRRKKAELEQEGLRNRIRAQKNEQGRLAREAELAAEEEEREEAERNPRAGDIKKIVLGKSYVKHVGDYSAVLVGRLKNKGELVAESIFVETMIYNKEGVLISSATEEIHDLAPGQSQNLHIGLDMNPKLIGESKVRVTGVVWARF